jgi:poly-beta-1,6-N-acetyl-D-glucosamine synthase
MIQEISILNIILISVFSVSLLIQLYFYTYIFSKTWKFKSPGKPETKTTLPQVSVIIAARNEAKNLQKNLTFVLNQNYSRFEVIVVNDNSEDQTKDVLQSYKKDYPQLKIITLTKHCGKKQALGKAIEESSSEYLVFTDADCRPASDKWLGTITAQFSESKQLILGFGGYIREKSFLNSFISYDTSIIALQYFGAALSGKAYMGVGRNLAYTKRLWQKAGGFSSHEAIASGDDDLFVISASTKENTAVCLSSDAFTFSDAKKTWKSFLNQKSRHISTAVRYNFISKFYSGAELLSRIIFWISTFLLLINGFHLLAVAVIILRLLYISMIFFKINKTLKSKIHVFYVVLFDIFAPFFYGFLVFYKLLIHSNKQW